MSVREKESRHVRYPPSFCSVQAAGTHACCLRRRAYALLEKSGGAGRRQRIHKEKKKLTTLATAGIPLTCTPSPGPRQSLRSCMSQPTRGSRRAIACKRVDTRAETVRWWFYESGWVGSHVPINCLSPFSPQFFQPHPSFPRSE